MSEDYQRSQRAIEQMIGMSLGQDFQVQAKAVLEVLAQLKDGESIRAAVLSHRLREEYNIELTTGRLSRVLAQLKEAAYVQSVRCDTRYSVWRLSDTARDSGIREYVGPLIDLEGNETEALKGNRITITDGNRKVS